MASLGRTPAGRTGGSIRSLRIDPAKIASALAEISSMGDGELPIRVTGRHNGARFTSFVADYPNGWRLAVRLDAKGEVTGYSASLKLRTPPREQRDA